MKNRLTLLSLLLLFSCRQEKPKNNVKINNAFYTKAWHYLDRKIADSSFYYFNKAKAVFANQNDSVGIAKCLINMAIISGDAGDYFGSQEISLDAIAYLNTNDANQKEIASSNYNNLGKISYQLKKYEESNRFYALAISLSNQKASKNIYLNNIALNFYEQKKYSEALLNFDKLIKDGHTIKDKIVFARILTNISATQWRKDSTYNPTPHLLKALHLSQNENDFWGQNSSYAHLADYYIKQQPDSALLYANKMYHNAIKLKSGDDQLLALQKLIKLSPPKKSKQYFEIYEQLADSLQTARNAAKNQFALIRYETEKNKADNLKLQQENADKKLQLFRQKIILIIIGLVLLSSFFIGRLWYKKRKQKLATEAENAIKDSQLKTSKKVHDVVANGLYRIMTKLDNQEAFKNDPIIDEMEVLYEKSRNISYEESQVSVQNFNQKIADLLTSFASATTKIFIVGNDANLWKKTSQPAKYELEHAMQEIMVNMKKHSKASKVVVKFEQRADEIAIHYTDDGIGFPKNIEFKNGLVNTGNRIKSINGNINFENNLVKGLKIELSFPIS